MNTTIQRHAGPHPGIVAIVLTLLFNAGLAQVITFSGGAHYPGPWESAEAISAYFGGYPKSVMWCAFFQFGAAVPLGIFTATMVSRLQFLGVRAAGTHIALFGGLMTSFTLAVSALLLWVMAVPGIADNGQVLRALYYVVYAVGGPGYSVPMGILIAGISVSAGLTKLLPKWLVWPGILIALMGELSALSLVVPEMLFLIPLTRFPGFIWLILAGFFLPRSVPNRS